MEHVEQADTVGAAAHGDNDNVRVGGASGKN